MGNKNKTIEIVYLDSEGNEQSDLFLCDKDYTLDKNNPQLIEAVKTSFNDVKEIININESLGVKENMDNARKYNSIALYFDGEYIMDLINMESDSVIPTLKELFNQLTDEELQNAKFELKVDVDDSDVIVDEGIFGKKKNDKTSNTFKVIDGQHKNTIKGGFKSKDDAYDWIESEKDPEEYSKYSVVAESFDEELKDNKYNLVDLFDKTTINNNVVYTLDEVYNFVNDVIITSLSAFNEDEATFAEKYKLPKLEKTEDSLKAWLKAFDYDLVESSEQKEQTKESYTEDENKPGEYTILSASDLLSSGEQIPLVKINVDSDENFTVIPVGDTEFDEESAKIAQNTINTAKSQNKSVKEILTRVDKSLNHNDPFFSVEFDRSITNNGYELLAAQTLRTMRDDLKAASNTKYANEDLIVKKYAELTGVDYYTDKVIDEEQYDHILKLQGKDVENNKKYAYESPVENEYMKRLKDLAEDLIEKVNLKNDPDFYKPIKQLAGANA